ncbi:uncharacterized protein K489DRAFT_178321 [Dissoconium aciculare CBS 342.82]|uniref:Uncharacterized protein n=1 Tax=Dissoconium aciculare CBS 342.82 TaxID=1314786 RepID=A0A6J3M8D8_9PEZI|nr:uncharacterized protein K489DRAFT_178321 [Dissoconium aciculare CBS 342.82]KAF1824260.1 hypothetical protein K489DRAFT_178321 [Dissoconium aciculare CBS 342.82]
MRVGSDDPALLDLNPAQKKAVKAQKAAQAKQNEQKRQAALKQLQDQVNAQGGRASPQQQAAAKQLQESQFLENHEMQKLDHVLGPTDPYALQQALAQPSSGGNYSTQQQSGRLPPGTYQAYIVDPQTRQPTHLVTFQPIDSSSSAPAQTAGGYPSWQGNNNGSSGSFGSGATSGGANNGQAPGGGSGGGGDLLGGLLGSGQGLNVAGILAIGE